MASIERVSTNNQTPQRRIEETSQAHMAYYVKTLKKCDLSTLRLSVRKWKKQV